NSKHLLAFGNAGLAYTKIASYRLDAGEDGREPAQQAIDRFASVLAIDPSFVLAQRDISRAHFLLASHKRALGVDPRPSLDAALGVLQQCYRIEPGNADCKMVEAEVRAEQGQWARQQGLPDLGALEQAQRLSIEAAQKVPDRGD